MGLWDVVEDVGDLVTDVGKDVGETVIDVVDVFGDTPLIDLVNPGVGILAQLNEVVGLGGKLVDWASNIGLDKFLLAATSPILAAGQAAIADMRETTGSGEPETGDRLGDAEQRFRQATDLLTSAHPSGDWSGSGSDAYSAADTRQERRTTKLALLDHQLHQVIAREAGQIARTRAKLDDESNGLAEFGLTSFGYGLIPGVGPALKQAAEFQAVLKALSACSAELQKLAAEVDANAAAGQQLAGQYSSAAGDTGDPGCVPEHGGTYGGPTRSQPDSRPGPGPGSGPGPRAGSGPGTGAGSGTGGGTGSGGGSGSGGAARSSDTPTMPDIPTPTMPEQPASGEASDGSGGGPAGGLGGVPSALGGTPAGAGGGLASLVAEVIKAATKHSSDPKSPEEQAAEQKKLEEQAAKDAEAAEAAKAGQEGAGQEGAEQDDKDEHGKPVAAPGDVLGGRAPIHVELDVDPARLDQPMTVTLDRDHPIVLPSATTT
ncbi:MULTISPECIES: EspA/EspE family type VII secretion system effector [unclassified Mycobacterium]|uniref:EspA/EspE family type VII secretion system effector n=1 Tax=unclassified Mycobacterium TaxID=2642494 RepID=UPI0029C98995|nr:MULTISPECIES: EspA/EspE family type VII secretion system effector [unclassified Mycobacterium]